MEISRLQKLLDNCPQPYILMLIGPPLSGKTTVINKLKQNFVLASRDQTLLDVYGSDNYDEAFKNVNQKEVDMVLMQTIKTAAKEKKNVIIDMTNMTRKRRVTNLSHFDGSYHKVAIIFPILDEGEYERRNLKRKEEEQKFIPTHVLKNMISSYQTVSREEGFDKIISL